jgi:hypothetical protein
MTIESRVQTLLSIVRIVRIVRLSPGSLGKILSDFITLLAELWLWWRGRDR